jgi:hypothetical protein
MSLTVAHSAFGMDLLSRPVAVSKAVHYGAEYEPKLEAVPVSVSLSSGGFAGLIALPAGALFTNASKVRARDLTSLTPRSRRHYFRPKFSPFRQTCATSNLRHFPQRNISRNITIPPHECALCRL